jgi:hypothetical protein
MSVCIGVITRNWHNGCRAQFLRQMAHRIDVSNFDHEALLIRMMGNVAFTYVRTRDTRAAGQRGRWSQHRYLGGT